MIKGFRAFVLRGNVIDLAVAFVVGAAFASLIGTFSEALISPIVGIFLGGGVDVGTVTINGQVIDFTALINAVITFVITLSVIYFVFVMPMNKYRQRTGQGEVDATPADVKLLGEIRDLLAEGKSN
ncbi:MAG: large conductance mechanosensitive channel protein MscL [Candidatus Nanopelagicales bacterium]|jgi:large conductance mechanosensitive channel|nr:large conductance mechanosensitive channel protein MscL [Candidatus Nanopelagicales bacterium]